MTLETLTTIWPHEGAAAALVRGLKYRRSTGAVTVIADRLAAMVPPTDVVTWCPASPTNRSDRGFDQAELIARAVAVRLGRPCRPLVRRSRGPAQTGRTRAQRHVGPVLRRRGRLAAGSSVLVIDDVVTTGATLDAVARVLRSMGAGDVHAAAATRAERHVAGTPGELGVPSGSTPDSGGTSWTSPSAHGM